MTTEAGHATAVASIAVGLLLVMRALLRAPVVVLSSVVVAVVGVSTLVTGWHRMADAVGGTFIATSWDAELAPLIAWRYGVESVGPRTAQLGRVGARISIALGAGLVVFGDPTGEIARRKGVQTRREVGRRWGGGQLTPHRLRCADACSAAHWSVRVD